MGKTNDVNVVVINGRLVRNSEIRYATNGHAITKFSIACNKKYGDKESVHYFNVNLWGKLGEVLEKYLVKGQLVTVSGSLEQHRWKDNNDNTRTMVVINATSVQLMGGKPTNSQNMAIEDPWHEDQNNENLGNGVGNDEDDIPF